MHQDLSGFYPLLAALPMGVVMMFLIYSSIFVPISRRFVEKKWLEINVSLTSVLGGASMGICIYFSMEMLQGGSAVVPWMNNWIFQLIILGICVLTGQVMRDEAKKSTEPQGFVDWINNNISVPFQIFLACILIIPFLGMALYTGIWTWRHVVIAIHLGIFVFTFRKDVREGRMQQWSFVFRNRDHYFEEIASISPDEPLGWVRKEDEK